MAPSPTDGMNTLGDTSSNTHGPSDLAGGNAAQGIVFKPTFDEIRANSATLTTNRQPLVMRRYITRLKRPHGYRRPLSEYAAKKRMHAKLLEFEARFNSARTYDHFCEPVSGSTVPYHHAEVMDIVAPWMYPCHDDDQLSGIYPHYKDDHLAEIMASIRL
ncbi:hypothetical protein HDV57DRAFT_522406 [Trichoderma longibrachiatum]